jgi:hypothetical protein
LLWECILWYEDFLRINQREPKWNEELTEHAICNFKANKYTIPSFKRESLRHVLEVLLSNNNDILNHFADQGVTSFDDIIKIRKELEAGSFGDAKIIPANVQKELSRVVDWWDDFFEKNGSQASIKQEFTRDAYDEFYERNKNKYGFNPDIFYEMVKSKIHGQSPMDCLSIFTDGEKLDMYRRILHFAKEDVKKNFISENLRQVAPVRLDKLIEWWLEKYFNFHSTDAFRYPLMIQGDTQSGKSAFSAVGIAVGFALKVPTVVITKGVNETFELVQKLKGYAHEQHREFIVGSRGFYLGNANQNYRNLMVVLKEGGVFVSADTKSQIEKLKYALESCWLVGNKKFGLQVDEGKLFN